VFADLDGTLLDHQYQYSETKPIVDKLTALGSSVVFCSSKTRNEIEYYRKVTGNNEPFISENGAALFIPKNYFTFEFPCKSTSRYHVLRLGTPYKKLRAMLAEIKEKTAAEIRGFGDMTLEELAYDTGLPLDLAKLAKKREHDEPFRIVEGDKKGVISAIQSHGLSCIEGGRYFHLTGGNNKGKAVEVLKRLYYQMFANVSTYAVGDGPNDLPMLAAVDEPFFIKKGVNGRLNAWKAILRHVSTLNLTFLPAIFTAKYSTTITTINEAAAVADGYSGMALAVKR
jgi:mannosyl-3-phosphoglycerate phosphatase